MVAGNCTGSSRLLSCAAGELESKAGDPVDLTLLWYSGPVIADDDTDAINRIPPGNIQEGGRSAICGIRVIAGSMAPI